MVYTEVMRLLTVFLLSVSLLHLAGCAGTQIDDNDPAALFQEAEEEVKSDRFQLAVDKFRIVKNRFPYSKYSVDAQLRIADVYYLQESFAEAAGAYEAFRDLHPKHEKTPYAMFRIGKSYFSDIPGTVARDLTPANRALEAYQEYIRRFPSDALATEARTDIAQIRKLLAEKELYVADFYRKRDFDTSSIPRYQKVIELYPETDAAKTAEKRLAEMKGR